MVNALQALGQEVSPDAAEKLCGTTATHGTSTRKLMVGLQSIPGIKPVKISERSSSSALFKLNGWLSLGRPVILCVDNSGHWVACVGQLGVGLLSLRYLVVDSAHNELVLSLTQGELLARWADSSSFLGVVVSQESVGE